jgi:predicted DNA-binding transcriptional regulator AlpA
MSKTRPPLQMYSVEKVMEMTSSSRPGIYERINSYDAAIAASQPPPPGSLRSIKWKSKRLISDEWLRESLGMSEDADR